MFGMRWFKPRPAALAGQSLFEAAVRQARSEAFYRDLVVADTTTGRFELYTLHVVLLAQRLRGAGALATEVSQALFDAYLLNLDIALREMGVGDLSVGKKMKQFGRAFYGRMKSWDAASADDDSAHLIVRTVYEGVEGADPAPLAAYVGMVRAGLAAQADSELLAGRVTWPEVPRG